MNGAELFAAVDAAADGATISLGGSFEIIGTGANQGITIDGKAITLDLNGKTLTCGEWMGIRVFSSGALTLSDSAGGGKLTGVVSEQIANWGQLTITGVTVENTQNTVIHNEGAVSITGGEVIATSPKGKALENLGGNITVGGNAKISGEGGEVLSNFGGTITVEGNATVTATNTQADERSAIYNAGGGTVNIKGGTVQNAGGGTVIRNSNTGTINVSGGEVISNGFEINDPPAAAIYNTSTGTINVTGGKLTAHGGTGSYVILNVNATVSETGSPNPAGEVNVTGGELVATGDDSTAIANVSGTLAVGGDAIVRTSGDDGAAIINDNTNVAKGVMSVSGSAIVEATGGVRQSSPRAIINSGSLTVGGSAQVRTTEDGGIAVDNRLDFTLEDSAIVEATGKTGGLSCWRRPCAR